MADDDIEIIDSEDFRSDGTKQFSHQLLIMKAMNKCLEAGAKEMKAGYFNEKTDKFGNLVKIYVEDTRKSLIEAVKTLEMFMSCDLDSVAEKEIEKIKEKLEEIFKKLNELEKVNIENAPTIIQNQRLVKGISYREGYLNVSFPYYHDYLGKEVESYRNIFSALNKLVKRLGFYEEEAYEN